VVYTVRDNRWRPLLRRPALIFLSTPRVLLDLSPMLARLAYDVAHFSLPAYKWGVGRVAVNLHDANSDGYQVAAEEFSGSPKLGADRASMSDTHSPPPRGVCGVASKKKESAGWTRALNTFHPRRGETDVARSAWNLIHHQLREIETTLHPWVIQAIASRSSVIVSWPLLAGT
jgi:hypothetical protein